MDLLRTDMIFRGYSILGISETWLDNTYDANKLNVDGYQKPFRRDNTSHSGGSMVYVANGISAYHKQELEPADSEIICIELCIKKLKILVCNCYRPQHRDMIDFCNDIESILEAASQSYQSFIFLGDMNARNTHFWEEDITNTEGRILKAYFDSQNFDQIINEATRIQGDSRSCIDLIFTNSPSLLSSAGTRPKIYDTCDHKPIYATLKSTICKQHSFKRWVWNYKQGDILKFQYSLLNAPWQLCFSHNNHEDVFNSWLNLFITTAEASIPHYSTTIRPRDKDFMNSTIRQLMLKRDRLHNQLKSNLNDITLEQNYKNLRNRVVTEICKAKYENNRRVDLSLTSNISSKKWWKMAKSLNNGQNNSVNNTPLIDGNSIITDNLDKANLLNTFFVSQSHLEDTQAQLPSTIINPELLIEQKVILPEEVYEILANLDISKSTGPDGISNKLLRDASVPLAEPLSHLFNYSLSTGFFPEVWKIAHVIPIHKKDNPMACNNYRPISLLCCISKVFEKLLFKHIFAFLKVNGLLNPNQSGFIPGDSTINQLINICNKIYCQLDNDDEILAVFLDLSKAFDKVWHKGLLHKLKKIGITGKLLEWIESYLSNRKQRVVINGVKSDILELKAGVPQGSVLGPLLFLIYINDLCDGLTGEAFLFADDSSVFHIVNNDIFECAGRMNRDLELINNWAIQWLVSINAIKTIFMLFTTKRPKPVPPLKLGTVTLRQVFSHRHLGLTLTPNLSWNEHISNIIAKANKRLAIMKAFKYRISRQALITYYHGFIRPVIEYGDLLYDSCTKELSDMVEGTQLEAARTVTGAKRYSSHASLYNELGWNSLQDRRKMHKLCKLFAIHNQLTPKYLSDTLQSYQTQHIYRTRMANNPNQLNYPTAKKELYRKSFFISTIHDWNKLNSSCTNSPSLFCFKIRLKKSYNIVPPVFNYNIPRHAQIVIAQLRIGFSDLNAHLFDKGCIESPECLCGSRREDIRHFAWMCPKFNDLRQIMLIKVNEMNLTVPINYKLLLYGNSELSLENNHTILEHFATFIINSKRFLNYKNF
jgi:hypothetical protein